MKAGAVALLVALSLAPWGVVGAGSNALPLDARGTLGTLYLPDDAPHTLRFDTSSGTYHVDGVAMNVPDARNRVTIAREGADGHREPLHVWAFDFASIHVGPSTTVTVQGEGPLVLLSMADAFLGASLVLDGEAG